MPITTDELLVWVGRLALDIEDGRQPPVAEKVVRQVLDDLAEAARLPTGSKEHETVLALAARRLTALAQS